MTSLFVKAETAIVTEFDTAWSDVSGFFIADVEPFLKNTVALVERNGGSLLVTEAITLLNSIGEIAQGQWGTLVVQLLANAKAAGATTLTAEEQLAASTALQIAQNQKAATAIPTVAVTDAPTV